MREACLSRRASPRCPARRAESSRRWRVRMTSPAASTFQAWPSLALEAWADTCATLHRWTQIVGKIRMAQSPWINHSWHVTLYLTARGLTTSPLWHGARTFQIDFDFIDHRLLIQSGEGVVRTIALRPRSVADFYRELFATLRELGLEVKIHPTPNELEDATPLDTDREPASDDAEDANR